jgi:hypothetical protein
MRPLKRLLAGACLLILSGCATSRFPATELTPTRPQSAAELCGALWNSGTQSLLIRQSALFELQGMQVPMAAVLKLDPAQKSARLVAMNDMGVKLYDISVDKASFKAHFIIPELSRYPGFAEAVAVSVRRIFLDPLPSASDLLQVNPKDYRLSRKGAAGEQIRFTLGGAQAQLLEKTSRGGAGSWRVSYYQYQASQGRLFPGGIVLDDDQAGYRLTLWIESVEKTDE